MRRGLGQTRQGRASAYVKQIFVMLSFSSIVARLDFSEKDRST
jgi:hypothetical protein